MLKKVPHPSNANRPTKKNAGDPFSAKELLDVVGKPRNEVWQKATRADYSFLLDDKTIIQLVHLCGIDEIDSEYGRDLWIAFETELTIATREILFAEILDRGRPRRPQLKQAASEIHKKAKDLAKTLRKYRWEISVGRIFHGSNNPRFWGEFEDFLLQLIDMSEEARTKFRSGSTDRHFETVPPRLLAGVFDGHILMPPERCSPRCTEATMMENIKAARRLFVKKALDELHIPFKRALQNELSKLPVTDEALKRILQRTR